jgi:hypothetical protein
MAIALLEENLHFSSTSSLAQWSCEHTNKDTMLIKNWTSLHSCMQS